MATDWRNALLITGAFLTIASVYLLLPNDSAVEVGKGGYPLYQNSGEDGVAWPVLPLAVGLGAVVSAGLAWFRGRRS